MSRRKEANMISKEDARLLYNLHAQIETTQTIISELEEFVKSQGEKVPDIIDKSYSTFGSIHIEIPYFEGGKFSKRGAKIYNISYNAALRVLKNHIRNLKKQIKEHSDRLEKGGSDD